MTITGKDLIAWGFEPGKWFGGALLAANAAEDTGVSRDDIRSMVAKHFAPPPVKKQFMRSTEESPDYGIFLSAETEIEKGLRETVELTMDELVRVPTVRRAAVMPDACPTPARQERSRSEASLRLRTPFIRDFTRPTSAVPSR